MSGFLDWLIPKVERFNTEAYWQRELAEHWNCPIEVPVDGGRCDMVYDTHAIEVEWAYKWQEAIGQSLYYSCCLGIPPGIVLLLRSSDDFVYSHRLQITESKKNLGIRIWTLNTWELIEGFPLQNCKRLQRC